MKSLFLICLVTALENKTGESLIFHHFHPMFIKSSILLSAFLFGTASATVTINSRADLGDSSLFEFSKN